MTEWKPICDGYYEITRSGVIRRLKPGPRTFVGKMVEPNYPNCDQERWVTLSVNGKRVQRKVVDLIEEAFK